jgi:hypothetical protein
MHLRSRMLHCTPIYELLKDLISFCFSLHNFPGKGPTVIYHCTASSSHIHLCVSCRACDFLCSNHSFRRGKGILSVYFLLKTKIFSSLKTFWQCFCHIFQWCRYVYGNIGRILFKKRNTIQKKVILIKANV